MSVQVALIVYLAQIGRYVKFKFAPCRRIQLSDHSFVPAESAELGITDKILTKINTLESVSKVYLLKAFDSGFAKEKLMHL